MPFCPTGQEFSPKYNVDILALKDVDSIFSGQRKKMENYLKIRNNSGKFCKKILLVSIGIEFRPECNVFIYARKLVDSIFRGLRNKSKTILKNKYIKKHD